MTPPLPSIPAIPHSSKGAATRNKTINGHKLTPSSLPSLNVNSQFANRLSELKGDFERSSSPESKGFFVKKKFLPSFFSNYVH